MKLRRFIYIVAMILITCEINKHITYGFEVKEKARTYSTVRIGSGEGSYSLPSTAGKPGEVLYVNEFGKLTWKDVIPKPQLTFTDPLLLTKEECDTRFGSNKFLPLNPYYEPTRGYCLATVDGTWDGVLKYKDLNGIIQNSGISAQDMGRYCDVYYEQSYSMPVQLVTQLWDSITARLPRDRYWDKFETEEQQAIQDFIGAVKGKKIYLNYWNNFAVNVLELIGIVIGGFRLTDQDLTELEHIDLVPYPYGCKGKINSEGEITYDNRGLPYCSKQFSEYGDFWDGRMHLESIVAFRVEPFCPDLEYMWNQNNCVYDSLYAICVR